MRMRMRFAIVVLLASGASVWAQTSSTTTKSDAEIQKEDLQAEQLYQQQDFLGALPLFEDLHQQKPENYVFRERLAMTLLGKAGAEPPAEAAGTRDRARKLLLDARAAGDNSNLLQIVLEELSDPGAPGSDKPESPGAEALRKAEAAFSSGDMEGAIAYYKQAADADPKMYDAPLFAGDAEYKLKHYDEAGRWYSKAIAIDPNRETAYRYWGDVLMHKGDQQAARSKFIDAVIANPYAKRSWIGLEQWASTRHVILAAPQITLPKQPVPDAKGNVNVTIDASTLGNPTSGAWLVYSMNPTIWRQSEFKKRYPKETVYRHSLAEETEGLRSVISVVKEQKVPANKLDPTLKALLALDKDGMLECWILLNHADQGIAQDYASYRATHWDLLHAYMDKYVVHSN